MRRKPRPWTPNSAKAQTRRDARKVGLPNPPDLLTVARFLEKRPHMIDLPTPEDREADRKQEMEDLGITNSQIKIGPREAAEMQRHLNQVVENRKRTKADLLQQQQSQLSRQHRAHLEANARLPPLSRYGAWLQESGVAWARAEAVAGHSHEARLQKWTTQKQASGSKSEPPSLPSASDT